MSQQPSEWSRRCCSIWHEIPPFLLSPDPKGRNPGKEQSSSPFWGSEKAYSQRSRYPNHSPLPGCRQENPFCTPGCVLTWHRCVPAISTLVSKAMSRHILPDTKRSHTMQSLNKGDVWCSRVWNSKGLLGFHALTGSDTTGRFSGRSKSACFKIFQSCDPSILSALARLGKQEELPFKETTSALEQFVCALYCPRTPYKNIADLRWHMFS